MLGLAGLLPTCQPADPGPAACNQPQADKAVYLLGQYIDPNFALGRDSVVCLNVGQDGYGFGGGWAQRPTMWSTPTQIQLAAGQIPGLRPDYLPAIEIHFVFVPNQWPSPEPPAGLTVGRYAWGSAQLPGSLLNGLAPRPGVEVQFRRSFQVGTAPDIWASSGAEQGAGSFFELTELSPHPTRPELVVITGRFTAQVFGPADPLSRARPSILLRNVQFRSVVERPEAVYRRL
jgi:hypothetical protein